MGTNSIIKDGLVSAQTSNLENRNWSNAGSSPVGVKQFICEICGETFTNGQVKANHIRWKHIEPNKPTQYRYHQKSQKWLDAMAARKGKSYNLKKALLKCPYCGLERETDKGHFAIHTNHCKQNPEATPRKGHLHTEEVKKRLSEKARQNTYRRIMRHTQEYHGILYDSSWEVEMAKRLESLNELFERPKMPLKYIGEDRLEHNYFPDFYLPNRKVFVEIKSPYLFEKDSKVQILKAERNDIIWLTSLDQIQSFE